MRSTAGLAAGRGARAVRIGIDGRALAVAHNGIGRYVTELCKVLDRLLPCASFFIYSNRNIRMPVESPRWTARVDRLVGAKHLHHLMWFMLRGGALCARDCIDVFWGSMTILPRLPVSVRAVVTVHDLVQMDRKLVSLQSWLSHLLLLERSLAGADSIVANSETTARKLLTVLGYKAAAVVRPGASECYRPRPAREVEARLRLYGITAPYILTVASRYEPRKNLGSLLEAFYALKADNLLRDHILVLAGAGGARALVELPFARTMGPGVIRSLEQVSDEDLALLYCGAEAFVFPSTHEGFGMPVAEARACGTKVVATDIPELHEAGGADAIYIPPSVEGIRNGITCALKQGKMEHTVAPAPDLNTWEQGGAVLAKLLVGGDWAS